MPLIADQRRDLGRVEAGIGGFDIVFQFGRGEAVAGEARQDREGDILIALACEARDLGGAELRPRRGHIKPAIRRQPGQQHIGETGFAALLPASK